MYSVEEAASYLKEKLDRQFLPEDITRLAKDGYVPLTRIDGKVMLYRRDLARYVARVSMRHYDAEPLSDEMRSYYQGLPSLEWWEALYIARDVKPTEHSSQNAFFQFPEAYLRLRRALDIEDVGKARKIHGHDTWIDTPTNWMAWFENEGTDTGELVELADLPGQQRTTDDPDKSREELLVEITAPSRGPNDSWSEQAQRKFDGWQQDIYSLALESPELTHVDLSKKLSEKLNESWTTIRGKTRAPNKEILAQLLLAAPALSP